MVFRREFTGEPHTVVLGSLATDALNGQERLDSEYADVDNDTPADVLEEAEGKFQDAIKELPPFAEYPVLAQNAAQPCYLETGGPPRDFETPCTKEQQRQPEFNGKQTYYSSGLIPSSGPNANEYRVPLADDIKPGQYRYYCAMHFPQMQGKVQVSPGRGALPDPSEVGGAIKGAIRAVENPIREALEAAADDRATLGNTAIKRPLAGIYAYPEFSVAIADFLPKTITTTVGEPVTWTLVWSHTISFNAPEGEAQFLTEEDGTVRRNPRVDQPAGGSPAAEPLDFDLPRLLGQTRLSDIRRVDGGTWNGEGYFSSGLIGSEPYATYTLRVSKPGRYRYSCMLHPRMTGTLVVND